MKTDKIGRNARVIWAILNLKRGMSLSDLLKISELNESDFLMAIGWLAREYKIAFYKIDEEQMVTSLY